MDRMNIPEGENVCCAADLFEYDESKKLNLRQFFKRYKDQFPMLIVIIGGHYGLTKYDCYDNFQVLRVHCYTSQRRVVADDARLNPHVQMGYITIPEDTLIKFRVVKGHTKLGGPQQLWEILQENDQLPLIVQTACDSGYPIRIGSTKYEAKDVGNIMIKENYEEHYFLMNAIDTVELDMNKLTCMACLSEDLDATPITGFKYASKAEFDQYCQKLANDVAESGESYDTSQGSDAFGEYSFDEIRSLLEISNNATGLLMEEQEEDSPGEYDYVEMPPLLPSRNPIQKPSTPVSQPSSNPVRKDINKASMKNKPIALSPKSPDSPKVHHNPAKTAFGFIKKKLNKSEEKEDASTVAPETLVTKLESNNSQKSNRERSQTQPKVPPHVRKDVNKKEFYSYADVKTDGYVKVTAHKPYQNTQIGRATVKPMLRVKNDVADSNYLKMTIEDQNEGDDVYETLDEKISIEQIKFNPTKDPHKRTPNTDQVYTEMVKEDSNLAEQSGESAEEMEEYGTMEFTNKLQHGDKGKTVPSQAPTVPSRRPHQQEDEPSDERDQTVTPDNKDKVDFTETVKLMSISEICEHLNALKLGKYAEVFEENQIDGQILTSLSVDDLQQELGLRKIEAIKLNKFATTGHIPR